MSASGQKMSVSWSTTDLTALKPDFRFTPESRLRADIAPGPVRANALNRCAIARCAGSPTVSAVTGGKIVKTQNRCTLVRSLRRCGCLRAWWSRIERSAMPRPRCRRLHLHRRHPKTCTTSDIRTEKGRQLRRPYRMPTCVIARAESCAASWTPVCVILVIFFAIISVRGSSRSLTPRVYDAVSVRAVAA